MVYQGFDREDGLWDIEAALTDVKTYDFRVSTERPFPAQDPIHGLKIRVTLNDHMVIQDIATSMDDIPHPECAGAPHGMHKLIGCTMGPGWRKVINEHVGGTEGCTHMLALLDAMEREPAGYIADEFLGAPWQPQHVADVIRDFAGVGCGFLGSATPIENIDALSIPSALQPRLRTLPPGPLAETARDLARNQSLRRDLFQRDARRLDEAAHLDALIAATVEGIADIRASDEGREGVASFLQKRKPAWLAG